VIKLHYASNNHHWKCDIPVINRTEQHVKDYQDSTGQSSCSPCTAGHQCSDKTQAPVQCLVGTYATTPVGHTVAAVIPLFGHLWPKKKQYLCLVKNSV
jgi:hypothetical protein